MKDKHGRSVLYFNSISKIALIEDAHGYIIAKRAFINSMDELDYYIIDFFTQNISTAINHLKKFKIYINLENVQI